ncbi:IS66 family insertion sequence element accessory protein TnpB, partial [Escherichia coli]
MISLPAGSRIWLVAGITDMRNGFNGLASKVQNVLKDDPFSGHLFIFRGRRGDQIKVLWADSDGLCLFTKRLERGRFVWPVIPDSSVQPGAGNGEPVTAEVLAQRQAEEAIRRETERRADEIVRKMAENKPDLPDGKTEQAVREIAGQERDRADITEREAALPESVLRESQREQEAVREVARENLLQERLQQMERDMV